MKKIVIVAGDKSGDVYGGYLSKKLKERFADTEILSFGGAHLAAHSRQIIDLNSHAVSGLFEVILKLPTIWKIFHETLRQINKIQPDLIILIDFPDFNIRLATALAKRFPVYYYISPQVWAWRKDRISSLKKYVDKMVVIFKFETEFYKKEGVDAHYFGHPLLEIIDSKPVESKKIISFMPGSRKNEISRHLPLMYKAKAIIEKEIPGFSFRIIRPNNIEKEFYEKFFPSIDIIDHSYQAIAESAFVITSSGTATVEIAVLEVPFLIIYKVNPLTWHLLKGMVKTKFAGMVNILAGHAIVKELLQKDATAENIAATAVRYMTNPRECEDLKRKLRKIKEVLSPRNATENFALCIGKDLGLTLKK